MGVSDCILLRQPRIKVEFDKKRLKFPHDTLRLLRDFGMSINLLAIICFENRNNCILVVWKALEILNLVLFVKSLRGFIGRCSKLSLCTCKYALIFLKSDTS